jgi:hypothetical protein
MGARMRFPKTGIFPIKKRGVVVDGDENKSDTNEIIKQK